MYRSSKEGRKVFKAFDRVIRKEFDPMK